MLFDPTKSLVISKASKPPFKQLEGLFELAKLVYQTAMRFCLLLLLASILSSVPGWALPRSAPEGASIGHCFGVVGEAGSFPIQLISNEQKVRQMIRQHLYPFNSGFGLRNYFRQLAEGLELRDEDRDQIILLIESQNFNEHSGKAFLSNELGSTGSLRFWRVFHAIYRASWRRPELPRPINPPSLAEIISPPSNMHYILNEWNEVAFTPDQLKTRLIDHPSDPKGRQLHILVAKVGQVATSQGAQVSSRRSSILAMTNNWSEIQNLIARDESLNKLKEELHADRIQEFVVRNVSEFTSAQRAQQFARLLYVQNLITQETYERLQRLFELAGFTQYDFKNIRNAANPLVRTFLFFEIVSEDETQGVSESSVGNRWLSIDPYRNTERQSQPQ